MNNNLFMIFNHLILIFLLTLTSSIYPYVMKKTISFGIRIPESEFNNKDVKKIRNRYRNIIIISGVVCSVISIFLIYNFKNKIEVFNQLFVYILLLIHFIVYIFSYLSMKKLKEKSNWAVNRNNKVTIDTSFRHKKIAISKLWFLLYIVIILLTLMIPRLVYNELPNELPIHYDYLGNADTWEVKDKAILYMPISQIFILIVMFFVYIVIKNTKQELDNNNPEKSAKNNARFRYVMTKLLIIFGLIMEIELFINQLYIIDILKNKLWIVFTPLFISITIIILLIAIVFKIGQGGWKLGKKEHNSNIDIDRDDDKYWKLGSIYFNPNDPAIFVEKRFGIGWTNNMARPVSWVMLIGFIILILVFYKIMRRI